MKQNLILRIILLLAFLSGSVGWGAGYHVREPDMAVYRISGVVVNSHDGSPIPQCRVSVTAVGRTNAQTAQPDSPDGSGGRTYRGGGETQRQAGRGEAGIEVEPAITDRRGQFVITLPRAGVWRLTGRARGYRAQSYEQHEQFWSGVVVTGAAPEATLTLRLTPDAGITGVVSDEAGEAVRNAQVRVEPVRTAGPNEGLRGMGGALNATTDDRGRYEVTGLQPGKYRVKVNAQPWYASVAARPAGFPDPSLDMVYAETWYPAASDAEGAEAIPLVGGEQRQADFHLTPVPSIHLHIPMSPDASRLVDGEDRPRGFRGPIVSRQDSAGGVSSVSATVTDGKEWDVGGLTPGSYQVRFASNDGHDQKLYQVAIRSDSPAIMGLGSTSTATNVSLAIDGVEDGEVRQITLVDVVSRRSFRTNMRTERRGANDEEENDEPGGVRTVTAPAGRYEIYLNGARGLYLAGLTATSAKVAGRTLEFAGGSPKVIVHARIGEGEVDGVARLDGKAAVGAMVLLVPAGYGRLENVAPVEREETNSDGSFAVANIIPGEYILVVIDHGWDVNWRDSSTLARYLASGTPVNLVGSAILRKDVEAAVP